ncbi:MAG TPA: nuclear transport factor 2 family protein [Blastocatellia bacterium]|nr:nuclear transport factor 2 family protein [Blastocatellia bacterium]
MIPAHQELLTEIYRAFNARELETILPVLHPEVDWPNGWEGGHVHGPEGVRNYWTRQWQAINPSVEPVGFETEADGRTAVKVHAVVRDLQGNVIHDGMVRHVYLIQDGLIRHMEIQDPGT